MSLISVGAQVLTGGPARFHGAPSDLAFYLLVWPIAKGARGRGKWLLGIPIELEKEHVSPGSLGATPRASLLRLVSNLGAGSLRLSGVVVFICLPLGDLL